MDKETEKAVRNEMHWFVWVLGLGFVLVAYGHNAFATKSEVQDIKSILNKIDNRVYELHKGRFPSKYELTRRKK